MPLKLKLCSLISKVQQSPEKAASRSMLLFKIKHFIYYIELYVYDLCVKTQENKKKVEYWCLIPK